MTAQKKNTSRLTRVSFLYRFRDLPNSDCYRRSIACNGRCRPNNAKHCCVQIFCTQVQVTVYRTIENTSRLTRVFLWCGHRDLNSDGVTIRPSNVRVCLFRHDRLTLLIIWLKVGRCQGVLRLNFAKRQHFFQTHILSLWARERVAATFNRTAWRWRSLAFRATLCHKTCLRAHLRIRFAGENRAQRLQTYCSFCKFCPVLWKIIWFEGSCYWIEMPSVVY